MVQLSKIDALHSVAGGSGLKLLAESGALNYRLRMSIPSEGDFKSFLRNLPRDENLARREGLYFSNL